MIPGLTFIRTDIKDGKEVGVFDIDPTQIVMITDCTTEEIIFAAPAVYERASMATDEAISKAKNGMNK